MSTPTGYLVCGAEYPLGAITPVVLTLSLLNNEGQLVRKHTFRQSGYDYYPAPGEGFFALPDGGYALASSTNLPSGQQVASLWRFTPAGDTLWSRHFALAPVTTICYGGCRTRDGGFALIGVIVPPGGGSRQMLLIRTDSLGTLLWQRTYSLQVVNAGWTVAELPDGGFILGGVTSDRGYINQGTYVVRTDAVGNLIRQRRLGSAVYNNGIGIVRPTRDGGWAVLAAVGQPPQGSTSLYRHCVYKFNATGQTQWQRQIGPVTYIADANVLLELADGSLVAGGEDGGVITAPVAVRGVLFKLCADGDSVWYRNYRLLTGEQSDNYLRGLAATPDGGFVAAGFLHVYAPDTGTPDGWVFKTDSAGYLQAGGAPVGVRCRPVGLGAEPEAEGADALVVWPNPAADGVRVRPATAGPVELLDGLGRVVRHARVAAGQVVAWELADLPPGLYVVRAGGRARRLVVE